VTRTRGQGQFRQFIAHEAFCMASWGSFVAALAPAGPEGPRVGDVAAAAAQDGAEQGGELGFHLALGGLA
jgi:hypothetical protein